MPNAGLRVLNEQNLSLVPLNCFDECDDFFRRAHTGEVADTRPNPEEAAIEAEQFVDDIVDETCQMAGTEFDVDPDKMGPIAESLDLPVRSFAHHFVVIRCDEVVGHDHDFEPLDERFDQMHDLSPRHIGVRKDAKSRGLKGRN